MLEKITRGMLVIGMINFPFIKIINKNKINPPIAYLEKTKKKRDEPSSRAIFAEFGTKAKKKDDNKTIKIPVFIITTRVTKIGLVLTYRLVL